MRPVGLSAFVRCKNEEEYIVACVLSAYRVFDEILVVLNNSTDRTRELLDDLIVDHPKIRLLDYPNECCPIGPGYFETVKKNPSASLARYYNWCVEQTRFSHVCKWDGDMIATPLFEQVTEHIASAEVINFDGYDVLGEHTTDIEPRIFKYDARRARYVDWDLYEVLEHDYGRIVSLQNKCYLHMKLIKREWRHKHWSSPNLLATRSAPQTGAHAKSGAGTIRALIRRVKCALFGAA